jgi:tRNA nucleotidyltransferase (CCA-adding enzyme)
MTDEKQQTKYNFNDMVPFEQSLKALPVYILDIFAFFAKINLPIWLVGGSLRDLLLGKLPQDWDFATPSLPEQTRLLLENHGIKVYDTGLAHGTLTFYFEQRPFEITTFREDGPYQDHRHPDWVDFTSSLALDLARRDFTINALAYAPEHGLQDDYQGKMDLSNGLIRCVGDPEQRFKEDALRILRGIRLAAQLGFQLESHTAQAMQKHADLLQCISWERIRDEFNKMLLTDQVKLAFDLLRKLHLWPYILPAIIASIDHEQFSEHHFLDIYEHTIKTIENTPQDLTLRLAALFHDIGKPDTFTLDKQGKGHFYGHAQVSMEIAQEAMQRLRYSKEQEKKVLFLIKYHMLHLQNHKDLTIRRFLSQVPEPRKENLADLFALQEADLRASAHQTKSLEEHRLFKDHCYSILNSGVPLSLKQLAITGQDLILLNVPPRERSPLLRKLLNRVLAQPELNTRELLIDQIKELQTKP